MRAFPSRLVLPWSIGLGLAACAASLAASLALGLTLRDKAARAASRETTSIADGLAGRIESGFAALDRLLREATIQAQTGTRLSLDGTSIAAELSFVNVLNEAGDVVADARGGTLKPANFAGRDYFQDQLKNPTEGLAIGRPFATARSQHAAIPISRRVNNAQAGAKGGFSGVAVAGLRLSWLRDLLARPSVEPAMPIAALRDDGLILARAPFDLDAIGRNGAAEPAWRAWQRSGASTIAVEGEGTRVFRRIANAPLVLELAVPGVAYADWLWAPMLGLVPAFCCLGFAGLALIEHRRGEGIAAAAHAANDERMRTMATMSHELRTPLTGILGQAAMLRDEGGLDPRQASRLARLNEAGTLMRGIVDRTIDIARPEDHDSPLTGAPVDLDALVRTCRGMVECEAREKGLHLTSHVAPAAPRHPVVAGWAIQQILGNLLMNAVKFTQIGTVELRAMGDATRLRFEVADTGPGIPAAKRGRLFRAYDRLDIVNASAAGSGLGLSISARLIRRMDGRIGQTANPGGGSVFWIEIPTALPATSQPMPPKSATEREGGLPRTLETPRALRLLLADDDESSRTVAADILRAAGHTVVAVEDGAALLEAAGRRDFDAILTDVRMPRLDGLTAIARLRAIPGHRGQVPVVLVTADAEVARGQALKRSGADGHVTKPYEPRELLTAVEEAARLAPVPKANPWQIPSSELFPSAGSRAGTRGSVELSPSARADPIAMAGARSEGPPEGGTEVEAEGGHAAGLLAVSALVRVETLLALLDRPQAGRDPVVRDAAHDLTGTAGLMGLTGLAEALRRFNAGEDIAATRLKAACADVVCLLRRQPERPRMDRSLVDLPFGGHSMPERPPADRAA